MKTSPEQSLQNSIGWMLGSHPDKVLWLLTKMESIYEDSSRPVGCWVIGLLSDFRFKVGNRINMSRLANQDNPEGKMGWFQSSTIQAIEEVSDGYIVKTINSVYHLKQLNSVMDVIRYRAEELGQNIDGE